MGPPLKAHHFQFHYFSSVGSPLCQLGLFFSFFPFMAAWLLRAAITLTFEHEATGTHQRLCLGTLFKVLFCSFKLPNHTFSYYYCSFSSSLLRLFLPPSLASVQEQRHTGAAPLPGEKSSSSEGNHSDGEVHTIKVQFYYL